MSKYTMQLREIYSPTIQFEYPFYTKDEVIGWFEDYELTDFLTNDEINVINSRGTWNKHKLATKIVNHYFMREIGFETMALFRENAKNYMYELMEEYLPLIYSASIEYDPLINVDYTENYERQATNEGSNSNSTSSSSSSSSNSSSTSNSSSSSTSSSSSSSLNVNSDTPQGQISKTAILNGAYASSTGANESTISDSTSASNSNTATNSNSGTNSNSETNTGTNENELNENYTKHVKGNSGVSATSQRMIQQYRDNIRAIDREIIEKCNILFMGIF